MVPKGWRKKALEGVAQIRTGLAKGKRDLVAPVRKPYLRVANVQDGYLDLSEIKEIEVSEHDLHRYMLQDGDILLTEGGDFDKLGRGSVWRAQIPECLHQNHVFAVRVHRSELMPEFFAAQTASPYGKNYFLSCAKRTTNLASINSTQIKQFPVLLPPLPEQKKIAEILSTWDKAIETTEKLLANGESQKRALMQQLLTGKRRLPGFEGQEWREVRLGDVGKISSAGVDKKVSPNDPQVRLLNFLDVFRREFIFDAELNHIVTAPASKVKQCDVRKGDVFFTPSSETRDEIGIPAVAAEDMPGVCYSYHVVRFRLDEDWDLNFRAYVFQSSDFRRQAYRLGDGSGQRYVISQDNFRNMTVRVPGKAEQERIGALLRAASDEIAWLVKYIDKLRTEKKALMQQLLTGKRRVKV